MTKAKHSGAFKGHRFPPEIIAYAVWSYFRFADVAITLLCDLAQSFLAAARLVERGQPQPCRQITPGPELMRVPNRGNDR